MKVMVLGKATEQSEAGELGAAEDFAAMDRSRASRGRSGKRSRS